MSVQASGTVAFCGNMSQNESIGKIDVMNTEAQCFQWKIADFFTMRAGLNKYFPSPTFSFSGCHWKLLVYPHGFNSDDWISVYLNKESSEPAKTVAFTIGVMKVNGKAEERETSYHNFPESELVCGYPRFWSREDLQIRKSELAPSDTLTLTCRIVNDVPQPLPIEVIPQDMKLMELKTLSQNFKDLFINKNECDVTIKVKDEEFQAHRAVLMARSPVFAAMFEHKMSEKETGIVTVPDCDPDTFGDFLHYLYTGSIEGISFKNAYHLYVTAEKYDVKELNWFCVAYMMRNLTVDNVCDVVSLAEQYDDTALQSSGQTFFNKNFNKIFSTAEWKRLLKKNYLLAYRLLEEMAAKVNPNMDLNI